METEARATSGAEPKSWLEKNIAPIVALAVIALGFAYLFLGAILKYINPDYQVPDTAAVLTLIAAVVYYWYSSSPGSAAKDKIIAALKGTPNAPTA